MEFCSTRDSAKRVSAAEAVLCGLSPDGGLFLPAEIPHFAAEQVAAMAKKDYPAMAKAILTAFLPGYTEPELDEAVAAYRRFTAPEVAPVRKIKNGMWAMELWHGPTHAFKDFALQLLPRLLTAAARKCGTKKEIVILVATSGDTGKAALEGFADVPGTRIGVFYPDGGVSPIQRLQMVTQAGGNVAVWGVDGNFDDTQNGVKAIFSDKSLAARLDASGKVLSSANSINWGRLAPQIAYYYWAYAQMLNTGAIQNGDIVDFCVPTGNFGDILAGYYAKRSGLPIGKLICASNRNNVLTQFLTTGVYDRRRQFHRTHSPSMDILISSNLERLLFLLSNDDRRVSDWMEQLRRDGFYDVGPEMLERIREEGFLAYCCDDERGGRAAGELWEKEGYLCDPHTAVAVNAVHQHHALTGDRTPVVVVSTASPFKFPDAVLESINVPFSGEDFEMLEALSILSRLPVPDSLASLKTAKEIHTDTLPRSGMKSAVEEWLSK
ncbi:MAG: threonine synthase [Clostridiaceae bacterium]|nr:threonine synthase [Clostridiaceae bacterium]